MKTNLPPPVSNLNCKACHEHGASPRNRSLRNAVTVVSETKEFLKELISAEKVLLVELASLIWLALTIYSILSSKGVSASAHNTTDCTNQKPPTEQHQRTSKRQCSPELGHASYHRLAMSAFTAMHDTSWVENYIDAFILGQLNKKGLAPAPMASKQILIRRVYYDLTGLPPTPAERAAFLVDKVPDTYSPLIEHLLASPSYGERWASHWLDVARYAHSSSGFSNDFDRPNAWCYRDWVIQAFNNDNPYDQFVKEQLAGDELDTANHEYVIASGFQRLSVLRKNAVNQEVASSRNEVRTEMTNIIASAVHGIILGCARCHDHKFDPSRRKDYYRMQGIFKGREGSC